MPKRINLVTGAMGFSGSYTVRDLLRRGETVIGTDRAVLLNDGDHHKVLRSIGLDIDDPKVTWIASDLLDPPSLNALFEEPVTHVFHTASLYDYSASYETLHRVNVEGTRNLLEATLWRATRLERFVHWSTCGVFGKPYTAASGKKVNLPFEEASSSPKNTPPGAKGPVGTKLVNDYSVSKWVQEKMLWEAYRDRGLPLIVVRPAPIYGPGSAYGHGGIILAIAQGLVPAIPADSRRYITTSVHVADIAGFAIFAADHEEFIGEDFNVVDNSIVSYHEFLNYIGLLTGRTIRDLPLITTKSLAPVMSGAAHAWTYLQRRFGVPRVRVFEIQSAEYVSSSYWLSNRKTLEVGYEYQYPDVREGLKDTVAWLRRQGWLTDRRRLLVTGAATGKS